MDTFRGVARFLGVTVTLIFVLAVSAFGDGMNNGRHEDSLKQGETVGTSGGSTRFADLNSGVSFGQDKFFERTSGIHDGYLLRLSWDDHYKNWSDSVGGGSSTAMPEPASLLLLVTGVGPLLYARRRARKA